jgi:hypothetical protein
MEIIAVNYMGQYTVFSLSKFLFFHTVTSSFLFYGMVYFLICCLAFDVVMYGSMQLYRSINLLPSMLMDCITLCH